MGRRRIILAGWLFALAAIAACLSSEGTTQGTPEPRQVKAVDELLEKLQAAQIPSGPPLKPVQFQLPGGGEGWAVQLEGNHAIATPAFSDGRLYLGGGFGSYDFYAFDAATGNLAWRVRTTDDGPTGAVVDADIVVFNTESCTVEARRKTDGELLWGRWLGDPLMSQPAIDSGRVFVCFPNNGGADGPAGPVPRGTVARGGVPVQGKGSHVLASFDAANGKTIWAQAVPGDCISAPVVDGDTVYAATFDGTVTEVALGTGNLIRQKQRNATSAPWIATIGAAQEIFVSERESQEKTLEGKKRQVQSEAVRRIDSKGTLGAKLHSQEADYLDAKTVGESKYFSKQAKALADSAVGFASPPPAAAMEEASGNVGVSHVVDAWSFQGSRAAVVGDRLFNTLGNRVTAGGFDGKRVDWEFAYKPEMKERLLSPPAVARNQLIFAALDGTVFSLEEKSGELRHAWRFDKHIAFQPAVVGGRIFVGTLDGWLIAIETGDQDLDGWPMWGGGAAHNGRR